MKYKKELVLCISCLLLAFLLSMVSGQQKEESLAARIAPEILRFHVLANSDTKEDQQLKLEVRTLLLNTIYKDLGENASKTETCEYIINHDTSLESIAETYMREKGYDYTADLELTTCYFPTKTYGDMVFPNGTYEAARVTLGSGKGKNWWCVLYPPLCFVDSTYAVVPETSKNTLESLLAEEDFRALMDSRLIKPALSEQTENPDQPVFQVKSKFLEMITHLGN